jgi:hypothetical protein
MLTLSGAFDKNIQNFGNYGVFVCVGPIRDLQRFIHQVFQKYCLIMVIYSKKVFKG